MASETRDHHFERVRPIVGTALRNSQVAIVGLPAGSPLVTYLAACGVGHWLWVQPDGDCATGLQASLHAQHGDALGLEVSLYTDIDQMASALPASADLIIAVGGEPETRGALDIAVASQIPALIIAPPGREDPCQAAVIFPGDAGPQLQFGPNPAPLDFWGWITSAPLCAGLARGVLLRHTPQRRADLADLWDRGLRVMTFGPGANPFAVQCSSPDSVSRSIFRTPPLRRGRLLIAGLGSLGSVAATHLVNYAGGLILVDPDKVDSFNPVRQAYPLAAIGQPKARALREAMLRAGVGEVVALEIALTGEAVVENLISRYHPTAALIVTGTSADFAIARALRRHDIPHIVGRCYPRARYWEAILVDGQAGPALGDIRGHLVPGPAPPPTPEQQAAYSDAGALEAEPATLIESGWAAAWLARLAAQFLVPPALRERWFLERLAGEETCLIGGVGVEQTAQGPAYGIDRPGLIRAWQRSEIASTIEA